MVPTRRRWRPAYGPLQEGAVNGRNPHMQRDDAIHPNDLREMVREAIVQHIDPAVWEAAAREESAAREALEQLAERGFS